MTETYFCLETFRHEPTELDAFVRCVDELASLESGDPKAPPPPPPPSHPLSLFDRATNSLSKYLFNGGDSKVSPNFAIRSRHKHIVTHPHLSHAADADHISSVTLLSYHLPLPPPFHPVNTRTKSYALERRLIYEVEYFREKFQVCLLCYFAQRSGNFSPETQLRIFVG